MDKLNHHPNKLPIISEAKHMSALNSLNDAEHSKELGNALSQEQYLRVLKGRNRGSVITFSSLLHWLNNISQSELAPRFASVSWQKDLLLLAHKLKNYPPSRLTSDPLVGACARKNYHFGNRFLSFLPGRANRRVFKIGTTLLRIEPRPHCLEYTPPRLKAKFSWTWLLYIPMLFFLPLALSHYLPGKILFPLLAVLFGGLLVLGLKRRHIPPRADQLALCTASFLFSATAVPSPISKVDPPVAWLRPQQDFPRLRKNSPYTADWGDCLCFVGSYGQETACWWGLQVFLAKRFHAKLSYGLNEKQIFLKGQQVKDEKITINIVAPQVENPSGELVLTWARNVSEVPQWVNKIIPAHSGQVPSLHWWKQIISLGSFGSGTITPALVPAESLFPELLGSRKNKAALHEKILAKWLQAERQSLTVPVGMIGSSPYYLDLVTSGPHALVAGTTGSGKSEALISWLLAMALRYSPQDLQYVLVDYKGGEAFAALKHLPQVFGVLTNLRPHLTVRALSSLRAELRYRERYQQEQGDISGLPRIVVVVDEFKILAQEHPEVLESLMRLAILGRSLKIHLILATQHPSGCLDTQIKANMPLKICLRVLSKTDSNEILGDGCAAELPAIPGRAWVKHVSQECIQFSYSGTAASKSQVIASLNWANQALEKITAVSKLRDSSASSHRIWLPELPRLISWSDLARREALPPYTYLLGLADYPAQQRQAIFSLPAPLNLLISGEAKSGRTNAAVLLAMQGLKQGKTVYFFTTNPEQVPLLASLKHQGRALCLSQDVQLLLEVIRRANLGQLQSMIIIDNLESFCENSSQHYLPLFFPEQLAQLCRQSRAQQIDLVVCSYPESVHKSFLQGLSQTLIGRISSPLKAGQSGFPPRSLEKASESGLFVYNPQAEDILVRLPLISAKDQANLLSLPRLPGYSRKEKASSLQLRSLPQHYYDPRETVLGIGLDQVFFLPQSPASWIVVGEAKTGKSTALALLSQFYPQAQILDDYDPQIDPSSFLNPPGSSTAVSASADSSGISSSGFSSSAQQYLLSCHPEVFLQSYQGLLARLKRQSQLLFLGTYPQIKAFLKHIEHEIPSLHTQRIPGRGILVVAGSGQAIQIKSPSQSLSQTGILPQSPPTS